MRREYSTNVDAAMLCLRPSVRLLLGSWRHHIEVRELQKITIECFSGQWFCSPCAAVAIDYAAEKRQGTGSPG